MGRRPGARWLWIGLTAACLALPLLPARYLDRLSTITDTAADETGSAQSRWKDQVDAVGIIAAHPVIGAGIGNDHLAMNAVRGTTWLHVHNAYLVYAIDLGLPGLALFGLLLWRCLAAVHAVRRRHLGTDGDPSLLAAAEGVSTSLVAVSVAALFHPISYHVYVYYIAGLAVAVRATDAAGGHAA
jgi:O-antigen ligase